MLDRTHRAQKQLGQRKRDRAYRRRVHDGSFCVTFVVTPQIADLLVRLRVTTEAELLDRRKVAAAIAGLLAEAARH